MKKKFVDFIHLMLMHLMWLIIRTWLSTLKFEYYYKENRAKAMTIHPHGSHLYAAFHEQLLAFLIAHKGYGPYLAMTSRSRDGDYAAFLNRQLGFVPVRGSSSSGRTKKKDRGGKAAMELFVEAIQKGSPGGGLTIDGPRGPRHTCKPGILLIASRTGAPVIPSVAVPQRYWEFNSWDKFKLPKFFSTVKIYYGEPLVVESDVTPERLEAHAAELVARLKKLSLEGGYTAPMLT